MALGLLLLAGAQATEAATPCKPHYYRAAQFGVLPLPADFEVVRARIPGTDRQCGPKAASEDDHVGCQVVDRLGVSYLIAGGLAFHKRLWVTAGVTLPMGLAVGDDRDTVRHKVLALGLPALLDGVSSRDALTTGGCLVNRSGQPYELDFVFDRSSGALKTIEESVETPSN